jgi:hypothetical protein
MMAAVFMLIVVVCLVVGGKGEKMVDGDEADIAVAVAVVCLLDVMMMGMKCVLSPFLIYCCGARVV